MTNIPNIAIGAQFQNANDQFEKQLQMFMGLSTPQSTSKQFKSSKGKELVTPISISEAQLSDRESPISSKGATKKRTIWSTEEAVRLTKSHCNISDDPIIGNDQKEETFWNRIAWYYNEHKSDYLIARTSANLRSHWHYIRPLVYKFNACHIIVNGTYRSGHSDEDIYKMALKKYQDENGVAFNLPHVWEIVKDRPSFQPQSNDAYFGTKKARTSESEASNTSSTQDRNKVDFDLNEETRPIGQKAAKRKAKAKAKATLSDDVQDSNNDLRQRYNDILQGLADFSCLKKAEVEVRKAQVDAEREKTRMKQYKVLQRDTSKMKPKQLFFHNQQCEEIKAKLKSSS